MWQIIKNEWVYLSRNKTLLVVSSGFVLVLLVAVWLGHRQTQEQQQRYELAQKELRQQWENIDGMNPHGAAHYGTYVFKPAGLLSSLDEGVNNVTGKVLRVEGHVQNEIVYSEASQMQFVSKFGKLKTALLLQYILPLLLLFLAFHSVSSEKQNGRLKLLVLQGAKPSTLVWAKTLSVWSYGMLLLSLTFLVYLLFNGASLNAEVINRSLWFYLSYALYYFVISGLTVLFSARWQNATIALTSMLGIWMLWTIFLPNILLTSVEKWHELPSRNAFQAAMKEDRSKGIDGHNPADDRSKELEDKTLSEYGVDSLSQLPINFDGLVMQADEEYGNQVWDKHFGNLRKVFTQQKQSYQLAGILSPFISLQNASMGFSASDNLHHQEFLAQVEHYRRGFIKTLNDKHAYGGSKTGDWGWEADNDFFKSVPDYEYNSIALNSVFGHYIPDLLLLAGWSLLISLLLGVGTRKMQLI
ncbi:MAG: DUF3526 domain-containing protein [Saprospiraceae bacterium]|nr:DUF3526 domain-containing protein [Saprospiraceae bacterium]